MIRLKEIRKSQGLTAAKVGERLGKEQATISRYESGKYNHQLTLPLLEQFAKTYNCTISELIGESAPVQREALDARLLRAAITVIDEIIQQVAHGQCSPELRADLIVASYEWLASGKASMEELPRMLEFRLAGG